MKKKKFVISSSLELLVPRIKKNLIFLGDWCFTGLNKKKFDSKNIEVIDYHWNNQNKLIRDYNYINKIYKILSKDLTAFLNKVHKKNFSVRYWEQIFGIWLLRFTIFVFDKYSVAKKLSKEKKYLYNYVNLKNRLIPNTSSEANYLFQDEFFNHKIFTEILFKIRPNISFIEKKTTSIKSKFSNPKINFSLFFNFFSFLTNLKKIKKEVFIISSYLGTLKEILLQLNLNSFPKFNFCKKIDKKFIIINSLREKNIAKKKDDYFLKLIKTLLIRNIPASYLEGYDYIQKKSSKYNWPENPKAIITANAHFNFDIFKFWLAEKRERNIKLIVFQHGSGYLFSKFYSEYDLDVNNCDYLLSWGGKKFRNKKILQGFNIRSKKEFKREKKENILLVQYFPYKYTTRLVINDYNFSNINKNLNNQKKFIKNLNKEVSETLRIRLFSSKSAYTDIHDYEKDKWHDLKVKHVFETREVPIEKSINNSKIVIINTFHSTLFFECLTSNIPCFVFSDFSLNTIKKECRKDFINLKKIGIIQDNPLHFSKFLNKNIKNIDKWWNQKKVLNIKNTFIKNYCHYEKNQINFIKKKLNSAKL